MRAGENAMGNFERIKEKWLKCRQHSCDLHEEFHRLHNEYEKQKRILCKQQRELEKRFKETYKNNMDAIESEEEYQRLLADFRKQQNELQKRFKALRKNKLDLHRMNRHAKVSPSIILIGNLLIWYLVFKYAGIKEVSIFFAVLFTLGGVLEFFFLRKLERRILSPIDRLKKGIQQVAKGNYDIQVEGSMHSEIGLLIDAFNEMASKLQQSEQAKAEYEDNRKALVANISHDLKTPITSIQGYIEAITEGNVTAPEDVHKYLKIIKNNTIYINKLIDDLFFFSKLDMQKLEFQFVTINIKDFVRDLMEEFQLELKEKGIRFEYKDQLESDCSFNIDRKRLYQVFRNILSNAEKYCCLQDLEIKAELYNEDDFAVVAIKDNGPGISEDKLPHIFDRFYRIDSERRKDLMSTGLGLAIAKELVEAHGGTISVTSIKGEGSCFIIRLPIIE